MTGVVSLIVEILALVVIAATALPFWTSPHWAVRMWEFPRLQLLCIALCLLVLLALSGSWLLWTGLLVVSIYQAVRIFPYTALAKPQIEIAEPKPDQDMVLLSANIELGNLAYDKTLDLIRETAPDVLFLMETDQAWVDALTEALPDYQTIESAPQDNFYGMFFASKRPARAVEFVHLTGDGTPTLLAELESKSGAIFRFLGLHPRPPVPGEDTNARDAQLSYAARFGKVEDIDLVVMGDFNDVVWSRKSHNFGRIGGFLDPRKGRGFISSFHARYPFLRFPIDHFFVTEGVVVSEFSRGPNIGSDHFPMIAKVRFDGDLAKRLNSPPPKLAEEEDRLINAMVERHRRLLDEG